MWEKLEFNFSLSGKWNGRFCNGEFAVWQALASLKPWIEVPGLSRLQIFTVSLFHRFSYILSNRAQSVKTVFAILLKTSHVTLLLQCHCWKQTNYHCFVDILSRYDLFGVILDEDMNIEQ